MDWNSFIEDLDSLVKKGQGDQVQARLMRLKGKEIPRAYIEPVASLARRVNLPYLSLVFLGRIIRFDQPLLSPPSTRELIAYSAGLLKVGAYTEGTKLLKNINGTEFPQTLLIQSLSLISQWRYQEAIPFLKKYISNMANRPYQILVGQMNLAACYIYVGAERKAEKLLNELQTATKRSGLLLLYANSLELTATFAISQNEFSTAKHFLQESSKVLAHSKSSHDFIVRKWLTVAALLESKGQKKQLQALELIKQEAIQRKNWETLRDCDYYEALSTSNLTLIQKLTFGTPYPSFQKKLKEKFPINEFKNNFYHWELTPNSVNSMSLIEELEELPGKILQRALIVLCRDFYRPIRLGSFYSEVFPNEYFNPLTSPKRIANIVDRLRSHFMTKAFPVQIVSQNREFYLMASEPFSIRLPMKRECINKNDLTLSQLQKRWPYQTFSSTQASHFLNKPQSSIQRLLRSAVLEEKIFRIGQGKSTLYRFSK